MFFDSACTQINMKKVVPQGMLRNTIAGLIKTVGISLSLGGMSFVVKENKELKARLI